MAIDNPAPHDLFMWSDRINASDLQPIDMGYVHSKFPNAKDYLVIRLAKAMSHRRHYLHYHEMHQKKLANVQTGKKLLRATDRQLRMPQVAKERVFRPPVLAEVMSCPICDCTILTSRGMNWYEHIDRDLRPYVRLSKSVLLHP
jgi:hypothetical protein